MEFKTVTSAPVFVGNGGITPDVEREGYFATLCVPVVNNLGKPEVVDIHITRMQAGHLIDMLSGHMKRETP